MLKVFLMGDVRQWLESLGLGQYAEAFERNAIDWDLLPHLDHDTLKEVGVEAAGHRIRIINGVSSLQLSAEPVQSPGSIPSPVVHDMAAWERRPGERRPVTMLFADVVGSTTTTERLDPEDAHQLLYGVTKRMCEAVEHHRGTVCRFMGDGIMAMFGAPLASEHHAVEACEAALAMQNVVGEDLDADINLSIRVGLHSGEVVVLTVGHGERVEYDASGPTVPIAARLEQSAEAGQVLISAATRRLADERIECEALAPIGVKGISSPLQVFALRRVRPIEEAAPASRTRFVGRRVELNQFSAILATCREEGLGHTVCVRGEAGIGKTRLVEEFLRVATERGARAHRGLVLEFGAGEGRDAIRSIVRSLLGLSLGSAERDRREAASNALEKKLLQPDERVFLNDLLDLPQPVEQRTLYDAMDNDTRNRGKRAAVSGLVTRLSVDSPLVLVVEDVHWADAVVLAHLSSLARTVASCSALLVITSRVVGDPLGQSWRTQAAGAPLTSIDLGPLRDAESMALIEAFMTTDNALAGDCLQRAAGNPLFLEQLLRSAQEGLKEIVPDSVQSLVLARMDRLNPGDKEALQTAAVIGQRFDLDCLRELLDAPDYDCQRLVDHDLVRGEGGTYLFAHALIQEGVYEALLRYEKARLHAGAARWYAERDSVLYAQHLDRASDPAAPAAYHSAARSQTTAYRTVQALALVERGLAIATAPPDQFALSLLYGELLLDLGERERARCAFEQALDQAQENRQRCQALIGIASVARAAQAHEVALEALERAQGMAQAQHHPLELAHIHHLRGSLLFFTGNAEQCRAEHEQALRFAEEAGSAELQAKALSGLGDSAYASGQISAARDHWARCLDLARKNGFGRVEVPNIGMLADVAYVQFDLIAANALLDEAIELATKTHDARTECFLRWGLAYVLGEQAA